MKVVFSYSTIQQVCHTEKLKAQHAQNIGAWGIEHYRQSLSSGPILPVIGRCLHSTYLLVNVVSAVRGNGKPPNHSTYWFKIVCNCSRESDMNHARRGANTYSSKIHNLSVQHADTVEDRLSATVLHVVLLSTQSAKTENSQPHHVSWRSPCLHCYAPISALRHGIITTMLA